MIRAIRRGGCLVLGVFFSLARVGPAAAGEVWVPPSHLVPPGLTSFPWPTSGSGFASFGFAIPGDFAALVSAKVVLIPKSSLSGSFDVYGSVKREGEIAGQDLLFNLALPATLVAGTLQEIDLTALLTGQLDAGSAGHDHVSVFFWSPTSPGLENATVLGLRFIYAEVPIQTADLANGAITTPNLADGAVTHAKLADDSVGPDKVVNNSLGSDDIANGSIGGQDINRNQVQARVLDSCPQGESIRAISDTGQVQCEPDTAGLKGYQGATAVEVCFPGPLCTFSVSCPNERSAMGGGANVDSTVPGSVDLVSSYPDSGHSWTVEISNAGPPADVTVHVICSAEASGDSSTSARADSRTRRALGVPDPGHF